MAKQNYVPFQKASSAPTFSTPSSSEYIREFSGQKGVKRNYGRGEVYDALRSVNVANLRDYSFSLYATNMIYARIIDYFSNLLTFSWRVTPQIREAIDTPKRKNKIMSAWWRALSYMEVVNPEKIGREIARKVLLQGACYIAVKENVEDNNFGIQYLPTQYCRCVKSINNQPLIDFNVAYFETFETFETRDSKLAVFPPVVRAAYKKYKESKLARDFWWVTLDPRYTYKFTLRPDDAPYFLASALDLMDMDDVKDMTMAQLERSMSKIIVQKFGTNSAGDPIISLPELQQFHRDTMGMVSGIPGVDVLTTYADIKAVDIHEDTSDSVAANPQAKALNAVYDSVGVSLKLFNADNAGSMAKSIVTDESLMLPLLDNLQVFLQNRLDVNFNSISALKSTPLKIWMPFVTVFSRNELSKLYQSQSDSPVMPAIILGQRQADVVSTILFEKELFGVEEEEQTAPQVKKKETSEDAPGEVGRPELPDDEKSDKTLANRESL